MQAIPACSPTPHLKLPQTESCVCMGGHAQLCVHGWSCKLPRTESCVCMGGHARVCARGTTYACVDMRVHINITCIHTYAHENMHICIHIHRRSPETRTQINCQFSYIYCHAYIDSYTYVHAHWNKVSSILLYAQIYVWHTLTK